MVLLHDGHAPTLLYDSKARLAIASKLGTLTRLTTVRFAWKFSGRLSLLLSADYSSCCVLAQLSSQSEWNSLRQLTSLDLSRLARAHTCTCILGGTLHAQTFW